MKKFILLAFAFCFLNSKSQVTIIANNSTWKYLDNGTDQGTAWYGTTFNDASWASGPAELGYGDGDEATVVSYGPSSTNKYPTTYFRQTFNVPSVSSYTAYTLNFRRDDGVIIYINGVEVLRNNMPGSGVTYTTYASTNCVDDGGLVINATLPASVITTGTNVIAAEVHQTNASSSDLTWVCQLVGNTNFVIPTLVKGPYLQVGTQNSMIVRWETNVATDSKVAFGTSSLSLSSSFTNAAVSTTHSIQVTGLSPLTQYWYSIGTTTTVIQGGSDNYFLTSPVPGTEGKYRFWVTGDCGNASTNQVNCKNQYLAYTGSVVTNGWLLLGDNAYSSGTNTEFNNEFFGIYQNDIMKKAVLWPAPGNHDYNGGASTATTVPYYSFFSTPTNAEAGGVASGNPAYYSYDYGNIHFLSLDSYGTVGSMKMYDTTGTQCTWIKNDLANTNKRWKVAYWHHPPYTMGSHNSDSEGDLVAIHTRFIKILERMGIDLILCGHSHDYERSKLMNGHYGNEASFSAATHNLSSSSGLYDASANSCPYIKDSVTQKKGTVYVLSGSAGQLGGTQGSFPHAAMYYSNATNGGSLVLDFEANRLDAKWVCADGVIRDKFTMFKDVNVVKTFTVTPTQTTVISASWPGTFLWSNAATSNSISVTTSVNTTFWVKDPNNCVADTFKFVIAGLPPTSNFGYTGPYCAGAPVSFNDISTNTPTSWTWSVMPAMGVTINTPASQNPIITFNLAGTYTVTQQSSNTFGPGAPVSKTITINALPTLTTVSNPTTSAICIGNSITLTGSGASTYTWTGGISNGVAFTPTTGSTYTLSATDVNGCMNSAVKSITVNPLPTITAAANPTTAIICMGDPITLTGSGATTYSWSSGVTNAVAFTPTASSVYTVNGTDANGCQNSATQNITVNSLPSVSANTTNSILCVGQTATITASGANTYSWSTSATTNTIVVSPTITTTYSVNGTDVNNCNNFASFTQSVSACTGVNSFYGNESINLFPNPNSGSFNVDINTSGTDFNIVVYNTIGDMVHSAKLNAGTNKIELNLKSGIYYYSVLDNKLVVTQGKLIIE